jgi:hypothetical protein
MQIPVRIEVLDDATGAAHQDDLTTIGNQFEGILERRTLGIVAPSG